MSRDADIPEGFEAYALGPGFNATFGTIYRHRVAHRIGFRVAERHVNPANQCHGGALSTFADMQIAAVNDGTGGRGVHVPTISLSIDYLAPAALGSWVEADVTLVKATRGMYFVQSLITADGEPVARANGIYRRYPGSDPRP